MKTTRLLLTFFLLWLSGYLQDDLETGLAYFGILTLGLLHGANDLSILKKKADKQEVKSKFWMNILLYVGSLVAVLLLFLQLPILALPAFIILSAYHFGEQHWKSQTSLQHPLTSLFYLAYGGTILFMIFYIELDNVLPLISDLLPMGLPDQFIGLGLLGFGGMFLVLLLLNAWIRKDRRLVLLELFYLGLLAIVIHQSSLLMGFALYFVLWHSLPSLADQLRFLYGGIDRAAAVQYWRDSRLYWFMALMGLALFYFLFQGQHEFLETFLISFLAAVTFPHVVVMHRMEH